MLAGLAIAKGAEEIFEAGLDMSFGGGPQAEQQRSDPQVDRLREAMVAGTLRVSGADDLLEQVQKSLMNPAQFGL
ncbi:MAG: hypothetical protein KDD64_07645 [Bdellovibrionales bacterium]|nr:hypothetical protein [Bdellovibrionales bacterium]